MNVDKKEIKKFDDISYSWWDPEGPFKPLHMLNPVRTDFIKNRINLKNKTVIDVGCGGGLLCENIAEHSKEVKGIDMSNEAIEIAKTHQTLKNLKIDYEEISLESLLKKSKKKYDVLTCMELVEHVPDPEKLIEDCVKITNRKADLFFSTLNRNLISYIIAIVGAEYILNILPKGTHEYEKFIKPSEFSKILRSNDLIVEDIKGISFNLVANKFCESNNTDINYIIHCKK
tara:strand:+ start:2900 stop:3589 length:690 start_codon:yes stop_codon:yes gene_type:complete